MFDFDSCTDTEALSRELRRFVQFWVDPVLPPIDVPSTPNHALPGFLNDVLELHAAYSNLIFSCQNVLRPADRIEIAGNRAYFLDIDQSGPIVFTMLNADPDPPVFVQYDDEPLQCSESLSEYLISFALQELMFWAALQENEHGECWDIDFPMICRRHGHECSRIWTRRPCIWPENHATFYLCGSSVLTMEQPGSDVRFLSAAVTLDPSLAASAIKEYPHSA